MCVCASMDVCLCISPECSVVVDVSDAKHRCISVLFVVSIIV